MKDMKFYQLELNCKSSFREIIDCFLDENNVSLNSSPTIYKNAPWFNLSEYIDLSRLPTLENPVLTHGMIHDTISALFSTYSCIFFVDGSVRENLKVGAAIYSPSLSMSLKYRLPDGLSIYFAEAYAVYQALNYAKKSNIKSFAIVSDNSKVLNNISMASFDSSPHPRLIIQICNIIIDLSTCKFVILCLPGHCGNIYINEIDSLAKSSLPNLPIHQIEPTLDEMVHVIEEWIRKQWKSEWEREPLCQYQKTFKIQRNSLQLKLPRRSEILVNRLRLRQTILNAGLLKLGLHKD